MIIKFTPKHSGSSLFARIVRPFGIRAIIGHTSVPCLEDDRLLLSLDGVSEEMFPNIVHNTNISNLESILSNGLIPGGGGITEALHSQLSAFHMMDARLQESSRALTSDAIMFFNVANTKPLLNIAISGVIATRET
ncbi:MAG: hypothetical protein ACKPKO_33515, partial [Candidatus Fonsibacter sp.]